MKNRFMLWAVALVTLTTTAFGAEGWLTDLDEGLAIAKKEKKPILVKFGSSDSCPPCIMMERETFSKEEFKAYSKKNLVLVDIDFPMRKPFNLVTSTRNTKWSQQFQAFQFPTFILLTPEGKEVERKIGFLPGGTQGLIQEFAQADLLPAL